MEMKREMPVGDGEKEFFGGKENPRTMEQVTTDEAGAGEQTEREFFTDGLSTSEAAAKQASGSDVAERQFFNGKTLDEHATSDAKALDEATQNAERAFFNDGKTVAESVEDGVQVVEGSNAPNADEKAA